MKKDLRFICYTYMKEKSMKVDYEVLSDALTVSIGMVLLYLTKESEQQVKADLRKMQEIAYHANGSGCFVSKILRNSLHVFFVEF